MSFSAHGASSAAASSAPPLPSGTEGQYCFLVEWFDQQASMMRQYQLLYHLLDDTVELYDLKNRRTFLKRCSYPSVRLADLYVGAQVTIYARQLRILEFGDRFTEQSLAVAKGKSLALVKPAGYEQWGRILTSLARQGLKLGRIKSLLLTPSQAQQFYGDKQASQRAHDLAQGPILALEIIGAGASSALLAATEGKNAGPEFRDVYVAQSERTAEAELEFLFGNPALQPTATFTNCTLALIKPHAIQAGHAGSIIDAILQDGFDISALELFNLDKTSAEEFLEVYKGVVPEYYNIVEQLVSGPVIALELRAPKSRLTRADDQSVSIVQAFRELVGPADPEVAKHIRPRSLRAVFGQNKIKNAVHCQSTRVGREGETAEEAPPAGPSDWCVADLLCRRFLVFSCPGTDLEDDGVLESQFFFNILQEQVLPTSAASTQRR